MTPPAYTYPLPVEPMPIAQAVPRLWQLRRLFREHALDARAGRLAVAPFVVHPSDKVARLAIATLADLDDARAFAEGAGAEQTPVPA